jgi:hypothetical protein
MGRGQEGQKTISAPKLKVLESDGATGHTPLSRIVMTASVMDCVGNHGGMDSCKRTPQWWYVRLAYVTLGLVQVRLYSVAYGTRCGKYCAVDWV